LLNAISKHKVNFNWVKWHNWQLENERCDELATNEILKNKGDVKNEVSLSNNFSKEDVIKKVLNTQVDSLQKNIKITSENQPCKKCWTPVVKAITKKKNTKNKSFFYRYYLNCPNCKTNYFVDDAKVML